jgi:hypothetical protein
MTDKVGLRITDVELNDVNGGSFSITVSKSNGDLSIAPAVRKILDLERENGLDTLVPYRAFADRVHKSKIELLEFIRSAHAAGKSVAALGASTKGNVLLQYCGLTEKDIAFVGEVNAEKYGCFTPGSWIPIVPEAELLSKDIDYLIVLPWHFRKFFQGQEKYRKTNLVFPLPALELAQKSRLA